MDPHQIHSHEALNALLGEPNEVVQQKIHDQLDPEMREFIAASSLVFISTLDANGLPDISPKGDPAGFVAVHDNNTLSIPERPGNKLMFGFHNVLNNPAIGLIFVIPNCRETLRIKGKATLTQDPELLAAMSVGDKPALLATKVVVQECFFHCGKAMIRSKVWQPDTWGATRKSLIAKQVARQLDGGEEVEQFVESELEKNYIEELY
ncbi:MAG: MSMEG_1061 family FMN-dependent PPOX-type flavoprotein [Pseudomonadales bacterium]